MTIDIESLSLRELGALVVAAEQRKQLISSRRPASAVRRMLKAAAAEAGYTLEELFGGEASATPAPATGTGQALVCRLALLARYLAEFEAGGFACVRGGSSSIANHKC
nr:hypothetical protein [Stenotrophomonas maltophilia]